MRTNNSSNESIGRLLKMAVNQMSRELAKSATKLGLTAQQMLIIDFLGHQPTAENGQTAPMVSQLDIEREFNIRKSTTTELLQRMEKSQLLTRKASPTDARQRLIELTDKGRAYLPEIRQAMQEHDALVLAGLSDDEIASVRKFLENTRKLES